MGRHVKRHDRERFADRLRRESVCDRPQFSEALHQRIVHRLPAAVISPPATQVAAVGAGRAERVAWRQVTPAVAAVTLAIAAVIVAWRSDPAARRPGTAAFATVEPAVEDGSDVGHGLGESPLGIETVPMFDEFEAGVREGVSSLAATLLDVPEWRMLADFDAAGFLGADPAP